jgi:ubiquinone/menaquinone biosynthesis C-methylase UbiE
VIRFVGLALVLLAGCDARSADTGHVLHESAPASAFPKPDRAVSDIVSDQFSNEDARDRVGEAEKVMQLLGVKPGMTVADIGAGNGYYTVRLSKAVEPGGRVLAEDIVPAYVDRLRGRVEAEGLNNVTVTLGEPHDPKLPTGEADLALLMHMYHEIEQPYGLLWHLHAALKPGGRVAVVDMDRPTNRHGTPPALLRCEMGTIGYRQVAFHELGQGSGYLAVFETAEPRPSPRNIRPCKG